MLNQNGTRWYPHRLVIAAVSGIVVAGLTWGFLAAFDATGLDPVAESPVETGALDAANIPANDVAASPAPTPASTDRSGLRVYKDPVTGEFTEPPAGAVQPLLVPEAARNESDEGLVQEPGPEGGVLMDLQGRFQSEVRAHRDENGRLVFQCDTHPPGTPHPGAGEQAVTP